MILEIILIILEHCLKWKELVETKPMEISLTYTRPPPTITTKKTNKNPHIKVFFKKTEDKIKQTNPTLASPTNKRLGSSMNKFVIPYHNSL